MKYKTIREATEAWVKSFNAIPTSLIEKAYCGDNWELCEVTPIKYICPECHTEYSGTEAEIRSYTCNCRQIPSVEKWLKEEHGFNSIDEYVQFQMDHFCVREQALFKLAVEYSEFCNSFDQCGLEQIKEDEYGYLPMWGWVWTFSDSADENWIEGHLEEMAECGFRIYESDELGYYFSIDGAGYDFYESHWIPLYKVRGLKWHEIKSVA